MLANAVGPALLKFGKKWYFITADYAFGNDAHARFQKNLLAQGGQDVANDKHRSAQIDFSSYMTRRATPTPTSWCSATTARHAERGQGRGEARRSTSKMRFGGILCGNEVAVGMPVDDIVGSTWGYIWGPEAKGATTAARSTPPSRQSRARPSTGGSISASWPAKRHQPPQRAGTTDAAKLIDAFEDYHYDAGKKSPKPTSAPAITRPSRKPMPARSCRSRSAAAQGEYFVITSTVGGDYAAVSCDTVDAAAAAKVFASETPIPSREGYAAVSLKA